MNINDIKAEEKQKFLDLVGVTPKDDRLVALFKIAHWQIGEYGTAKKDLRTLEGQLQLKEYIFCLTDEIYECANLFKGRRWSKTVYDPDFMHLKDEVADTVNFFFLFLYLLDYDDADKLLDAVISKTLINQFRRNSNY
jgi:NTP pyrophosphatase (non-canonical NTP hydrolase)